MYITHPRLLLHFTATARRSIRRSEATTTFQLEIPIGKNKFYGFSLLASFDGETVYFISFPRISWFCHQGENPVAIWLEFHLTNGDCSLHVHNFIRCFHFIIDEEPPQLEIKPIAKGFSQATTATRGTILLMLGIFIVQRDERLIISIAKENNTSYLRRRGRFWIGILFQFLVILWGRRTFCLPILIELYSCPTHRVHTALTMYPRRSHRSWVTQTPRNLR